MSTSTTNDPPVCRRPRRRTAARYGAAALALAVGTPSRSAAAADLEGVPWLAVFYAGAGPGGRLRPVLLDTAVAATFQGGVVSGSAGCNSYTAGYTLAWPAGRPRCASGRRRAPRRSAPRRRG
jgi:hypothetical protein